MKIAIPLDENKTDICMVLARAPFFLFWEEGKETVAANPAAKAQGGAGIQAAQFLADSKVDIVITPRCGQNAADVFTAADMKIFQSSGTAAAENITAYQAGKLKELTQFYAGFQGKA